MQPPLAGFAAFHFGRHFGRYVAGEATGVIKYPPMLTKTVEGSLEERLKQAAAVSGDEPVSLAQRVLDRNLPAAAAGGNSYRQMAALESFIVGMTDWVSKNVPAGHFASDDRESVISFASPPLRLRNCNTFRAASRCPAEIVAARGANADPTA